MSSRKRTRHGESKDERKRHKESHDDLEKLKVHTKRLSQEVQTLKHIETL